MKLKGPTILFAAAFLLAIGIVLFSIFYFKKEKPKTLSEIISEKRLESVPQQASNTEEILHESEEETTPPIPIIVRTESEIKINDSIQFVVKSHYLPENSDCEDYSFSWQEVKLSNNKIAERINSSISEVVSSYQEGDKNTAKTLGEFCNGEGELEFTGTLSHSGELLLAKYYSYEYFAGGTHPNTSYETTCYNLITGKTVNFHDLVKPEKIAELDSFIVKTTGQEEGAADKNLRNAYRGQLSDLNFEFPKNGLQLILRGYNYTSSIMNLELNLEQTKYYLKPEVFESVYKSTN